MGFQRSEGLKLPGGIRNGFPREGSLSWQVSQEESKFLGEDTPGRRDSTHKGKVTGMEGAKELRAR